MMMDETVDAALREVLPFESWERLADETGQSFAAFCAFRDYGAGRNIKRAMEANAIPARRYDVWRNWSTKYQWAKRAGDYDMHLDRLKRAERAKSIEMRETAYRAATERMLAVVQKRLDLMDPAELTQGNIVEWMKGSIDVEREVLGVAGSGEEDAQKTKQLEIRFTRDFDGV